MREKKNKGFTLIEMIVVIVIIAILAAIAVPAVMKYIDDARDTKRISITHQLFVESQVLTVKMYGQYGEDGDRQQKPDGSIVGMNTTGLIRAKLIEEYNENKSLPGYSLSPLTSIYYDGLKEQSKFDSTKTTHEVTKLVLVFINDEKASDMMVVIFLADDRARVFDTQEEIAETFDENSEWYAGIS